jgi:PAS domain S-box-containing protein
MRKTGSKKIKKNLHGSPRYPAPGNTNDSAAGKAAGVKSLSGRKRAEATLRESEERLSLALQASDAGTWDWDVLTGEIVWSPHLFSLFGIDPGLNASFDTWSTVLHPEDRAAARTRIEEALARHGALYSVYRIIRPDGEVRWINSRGKVVYDPAGRPVRMYGICIDITCQRNIEEALLKARDDMESRVEERTAELKEAAGALETERRRFFDVLEALPVYVCLLDRDYRMPFANRYFRETFMEPAGRRCHEFLFNRAEPCEICESYTVMKTRAPHHWFWTGPNGRDYDIYDYPFTDSEGSALILEMGIDITEQKKAEKALQKANAYNRSLIEASLDPLVTISPDGTISDVNEATIKVTGFSRAELVGTDFTDYFTEPERAKAGYERVFRDGSLMDYALGIRHRDGQVTPVLYNATVYRDIAGNAIGVFASARDITERKKTEEALQKAHDLLDIRVKERTAELVQTNVRLRAEIGERRKAENTLRETSQYLENLINYANAPIIVWDPEFKITLFNHAFEHLTDRTAAEVIGKPLDILLPSGCLVEVMELIRKTITGEQWESVEIPILHKKGGIRTILWNSSSIFGADGKTIVSIIAQGQDITDRKKIESAYRLRASEYAKMNVALEEEIRQREESDANLKKTLSLLNASLESTADGIYVVDTQGMITGYNQNFMSMWDIPAKLLESGENEKVMNHVLPQLKDPDGFLSSLRELRSHTGRESFDMIEFADGKVFERYSKPQKIGDMVVGRVWSYRDITDRKHAEEKLVASLQEKEVLLREIHHRVKNNLQLISGLLDMTRMRTGDESTNSILTDMMLKIQTMAQIHTRLYESKQFGKVSLTGQIQDQIAALSNIYSHKGHEISCEIRSEEVFLPVDLAIPCALVVNEILSNAYKHAFSGRRKGTIEISAVRENGRIRISIRDDGIGLPADFDISRTSSLGLKLIRTLVQHQLKGSLTLESRNGTEMNMEFPLVPAGT